MSSGPDNVTSTTKTEIPKQLQPVLDAASSAMLQDFQNMTGGSYGSMQPATGGGLWGQGLRNIGMTPATEWQSSMNPTAAVGGQGGGGQGGLSNIFTSLDSQFNRAADLTRGRLDTEFAGAGRNLGASMPARSEELQTLASNIYDPANLFNFDPTNILINRLAGVVPNAGGTTISQQPVYRTGLF